jgi:MFS family permease
LRAFFDRVPASATTAPPRRLSLGVIFLTLYIDLIGFSIFFPLFPAMLEHYLDRDGHSGLLGALLERIEAVARFSGIDDNYTAVLFAGVLGSLYSMLQFLFAPFWGARSDRLGRRRVLLLTVTGTAASYLLWVFSGSFLLFLLSRCLGGIMSGNLSVATAAVADVTTRANRAKGMGLIGAAFGLGFITGPALGGFLARWNLLDAHPGLAAWGINPFSVPALAALVLTGVNLLWIWARFVDARPDAERREAAARPRRPWRALFAIPEAAARRANLVYFLFVLCFSGMELTLGFLAVERLGYGPQQLPLIFVYVGLLSILTQGLVVRRLVPLIGEKMAALAGVALVGAGFVGLGFAPAAGGIYASLALVAVGSGLTNAALTALVSLYTAADTQGQALGVYRSLGSLARAVGPLLAGACYWWFGSLTTYVAAGALLAVPWAVALGLPRPAKS